MNIKSFLYLIIFLTLITGCTPEFSINEDYKDVTISYALLNPKDTAHYIKIYKGFLTDGNPLAVASEIDQIYYLDSIDVVLEEYTSGTTPLRTITLEMTTEIPKDPGPFANPTQVLYYTKATLNQNARYRLKITNKYSGREIYADTYLVNNFYLQQPGNGATVSLYKTSSNKCVISQPKNGFQYEIYQTFYYIEVDNLSGEVTEHSLTRTLGSTYIQREDIRYELEYRSNGLLMALGNTLEAPGNNITRYIDGYNCLKYEAWVVEKNYAIYYYLSDETNDIVDNRMGYTNFVSEDGTAFGIFSSRNMSSNRCIIENRSEDSLVNGQFTKHLGFEKYTEFEGK